MIHNLCTLISHEKNLITALQLFGYSSLQAAEHFFFFFDLTIYLFICKLIPRAMSLTCWGKKLRLNIKYLFVLDFHSLSN